MSLDDKNKVMVVLEVPVFSDDEAAVIVQALKVLTAQLRLVNVSIRTYNRVS